MSSKINFPIILYKSKIMLPLILVIFAINLSSCEKFLETKSDVKLGRPESMADLEAILRNTSLKYAMVLTIGGADEYFYEYATWLARPEVQKMGYVWDPEVNDLDDWRYQYIAVFYANTVLFNLGSIPAGNEQARWNDIKGQALFFRAYKFYQVAMLYAPQYDPATSTTDMGIPLRLNADINEPSVRSTVSETYDQIIKDLKESAWLMYREVLPNTKDNKGRPTKTAAYAMLARVYLQMGDYAKAKESADSCLNLYNTLMDFNNPSEVNPTSSTLPVIAFNNETIFFTNTNGAPNSSSSARVNPALYNLFSDNNDIRKRAFFLLNSNGTYRFKGSYNGALSGGLNNLTDGLATDEVYLIRAEANARLNNVGPAMQDLNALLVKRWTTGTFVPFTASTADAALNIILLERRKELMYRGLRWCDLKRLNKDPRYATTISRELNGDTYELVPNDLRYSLLIPMEVMNLSEMTQNPR
jgi:tetratricopeptide (TPR) repeat protein